MTPLTMVLAEQTGSETIAYLHGLDLVAQSDGVTTEYFAYDGLGSVRQVADEAGDVLLTQTFDPYGSLYARAGEDVTSFGFTGEYGDSNGLLYLRARYYAPSQGRFFQLDPSRLEVNLYQYSGSNPILYIDPSGHCYGPLAGMRGTFPTWCERIDMANVILRSPDATLGQKSLAYAYISNSALAMVVSPSALIVSGAAFATMCLGSGACVTAVTAADFIDDAATMAAAKRGDPQAAAQLSAMQALAMLPDPIPNFAISKCDDVATLTDDLVSLSDADSPTWLYDTSHLPTSQTDPFDISMHSQPSVGFAPGAAESALSGMRGQGGHAMRHLVDVGIIPNRGSLEYRLQLFEQIAEPILELPSSTFDWRVGATQARGFAGVVDGDWVVIFVAKEGAYQGKVISAIVPDAGQRALMGLK